MEDFKPIPAHIANIIRASNDDLLYSIFAFCIDEMNARKNKEVLEMQRKVRVQQAVEVYNNATRLQQV